MTNKKPSQIVNAAPYVGIREVGLDGQFIGERRDIAVWDHEKKCLVAPPEKSMLQDLVDATRRQQANSTAQQHIETCRRIDEIRATVKKP